MHPVIIQQLAADHIRELHATAAEERRARRARRARRRAPYEQASAPPAPVTAGSPPDSGDASTERKITVGVASD